MDANKIKEVFADQAYVKSLLEMETAAQVQTELKKKGLDLSEKDVMKMRDEIVKHVENGTTPEELSLDQLDDVAGGLVVSVGLVIAVIAGAAAIGTGAGALSRLRW